jgi:hypothetical protein
MVRLPLTWLVDAEPVAAAEPEDAAAVGISERVTPAAPQREETAGARPRIRLGMDMGWMQIEVSTYWKSQPVGIARARK